MKTTLISTAFRNFMSYGNNLTTITFDKFRGTTLITGEDLDNTTHGKSANGVGKAQPMYSKVLTPSGWTEMRDLKLGDQVITPCGDVAEIGGVYPQGLRPTYRIVLSDGRFADADIDHLWQVTINGAPTILTTKEMLDLDCTINFPLIDVDTNTASYADIVTEIKSILSRGSFSYGEMHPLTAYLESDADAYHLIDLIRSIGGTAALLYDDTRQCWKVACVVKRLSDLINRDVTPLNGPILTLSCIHYVDEIECQCIHIDHPSHLYITDDYIVTHNTTLLNVISYGVFDKPLSRISLDKLVNNVNKKQLQVFVDFVGVDGCHYKVIRERKMKVGASGNSVTLYKDGVDISVSVDGTNKLIVQAFGMPHEMFSRVITFSAGHIPFLDLPHKSMTGVSQTSFIEELMGITVLTEKADKLKESIKDSKLNFDIRSKSVQQLEAEHQRYKTLLHSACTRESSWEHEHAVKIATLKDEILMGAPYTEHQLTEMEALLSEMVDVKQRCDHYQRDFDARKAARSEWFNKINKLQRELTALEGNNCPYCEQSMPHAHRKLDEVKDEQNRISKLIEESDVLMSELDAVGHKCVADRRDVLIRLQPYGVSNIEQVGKIQAEIKRGRSVNVAAKQALLQSLEQSTNPHTTHVSELLDSKPDPIDYTDIERAKTELEHQQFLLKLLTRSDSFVRKRLLSKHLPFLNERLKSHLSDLGLPHKVEFDADLSASISRFGLALDFGSLSAGQQARVNFALSLAFKEVKQRLSTQVNIAMYDEVLDRGLDATGVILASKLIKRLAKEHDTATFIVSHREEVIGMFDRTIKVQMSKGFSTLVTE